LFFEGIQIVLLIVFSIFVVFLVAIAIRALQMKNRRGFINSLSNATIIIIASVLYIFKSEQLEQPFLSFPFDLILIGHFLLMIGVQEIYIYRVKKDKNRLKKDEKIIKSNKEFKIEQETGRKALHLLGFLLIPPYFGLGIWYYNVIQGILQYFNISVLKIPPDLIPQTIAFLGILTALIFVLVPEIYRMYNNEYCLLKRFMSFLREDELYAVGPHVNMITGMLIPIILIPEPFLAEGTMLSGIIADGVSSIVGKKWGKLEFNKKNHKKVEGLISGTFTSFITAFVFFVFQYSVFESTIYSIVLCIIFAIIDFVPLGISDNILTPVVSGLSISFVNFYFF